jgi:Alpha/beta hydrolase of unknown function (DUF1400)
MINSVRLLVPLLLAVVTAIGPQARAQATAELAQPQPLRLLKGSDLWTIDDAALGQFVVKGTFADQRLLWLVRGSGWPDEALRTALVRPYGVDFLALARFLDSLPGRSFLERQSRAYRLLPAQPGARDPRIAALRAAILADARDGTISALGIVRRLPVPLVLDLAGAGPLRCSDLPCEDPRQCRSVLSWLVFLPACLQAATASA